MVAELTPIFSLLADLAAALIDAYDLPSSGVVVMEHGDFAERFRGQEYVDAIRAMSDDEWGHAESHRAAIDQLLRADLTANGAWHSVNYVVRTIDGSHNLGFSCMLRITDWVEEIRSGGVLCFTLDKYRQWWQDHTDYPVFTSM